MAQPILERRVAGEIMTTAWCPFNCKYCYIPKTDALKEMHQEIIQSLKDGSALRQLKKIVPNLTDFAMWGTEPTLTLEYIDLDYLQELFPKCKSMSFSTNMMLPDKLLDFAKRLEGRNIKLVIQVSCDGPYTDENRAPGYAAKIPENVFILLRGLNQLTSKFDIKWKSTFSIDNLKEQVRSPGKIDEYIKYFKDIHVKIDEIGLGEHITFQPNYYPSLMVPGKYTTDDGKWFAKYLKLLHSRGEESTYSWRLNKIIKFNNELGRKKSMFTCSGGDSNCGVAGDRHICHRSYYLDNPKYVQSVMEQGDKENWDVSLFETGMLDMLKRWYIIDPDNEAEMARYDYVMRGFHDFWHFQIAQVSALIVEMAHCGQCSKIFQDRIKADFLSLYINTACSCPMENVINTGTIHLQPISLVRMFGNGAFEELVAHHLSKGK